VAPPTHTPYQDALVDAWVSLKQGFVLAAPQSPKPKLFVEVTTSCSSYARRDDGRASCAQDEAPCSPEKIVCQVLGPIV
jgi:hypothetical protein